MVKDMITKEDVEKFIGDNTAPYMYNTESIPVFYSAPYWNTDELVAGVHTFLGGKWIVAGEMVHEFERVFSRMFNVQKSLMVNSGSSANLIMITALKKYYEWNDGDEIIVSPVGFPTTVSVIHQNNLVPVFADIEWDTLNFDLTQVARKLTGKTRAIFLSSVLGNPPDMDRLMDICRQADVKLIVDNCDTLGSMWNGKFISSYGEAFSNSFYASHHISTGEGGMVCTDNKDLMRIMTSMAWWGRDCYCVGSENLKKDGSCGRRFDRWLDAYDGIVDHKYIFANTGYNLKPMDLQGAIGLEQLKKFPEIYVRRRNSKRKIEEIVTTIPGVRGVQNFDNADVCWFGTPFICESKELKHKLVQHLENNKIQTRNYFAGNILMHPGYSFMGNYLDYPEANKVLDKVFFIGAAPHYGEKVFEYIKKVIKEYV